MSKQIGDGKPHISSSQLSMMEKCGEQWRRRYIEKEKIPPGIALCVGTAVHKTAEKILKHKCDNEGELISIEESEDTARDAIVTVSEERGLTLSEEEWEKGKDNVTDLAKDEAVIYAGIYHADMAPIIEPVSKNHIEKEITLELEGFDYDLYGFIDVVEEGGFRDLKTAKKKPNSNDIDRADQYTLYSLWHYAKTGEFPLITQDTVVKSKKPYASIIPTKRDFQDFEILERKLENFSNIVAGGVFPHASPMSWWCSEKFCGYYNTCKYTRMPKKYYTKVK